TNTLTTHAPALCGRADTRTPAPARAETGRVACSCGGQCPFCEPAGSPVSLDEVGEVARRSALDLGQRLLHGGRNAEERQPSLEERPPRAFVGRVEGARGGP